MSPSLPPSEIILSADRRCLSIAWERADSLRLSAALLRANCPSSRARRARLDGDDGLADGEVTIEDVRPVGLYAINLTFSDGHDRGIYPWDFLRRLANRGN